MNRKFIFQFFLVSFLVVSFVSALKINEFVVDPQTDWDGSNGTVSSSDEWIELYNEGLASVNLTGWNVSLLDGTNETHVLSGMINAGSYFVLLNPTGTQNNEGQLILYDSSGALVDSVSYGSTWDDGNISDNADDGNANNVSDECLARIPNGIDTDNDASDFVKTACTYGVSNSQSSSGGGGGNETDGNQTSSQDLNVTIDTLVFVEIQPKTLNFGKVAPSSTNNPALNGPITLNASGSNTDVRVEVMNVTGYPFEQGLMLDGNSSVGKFWNILCNQIGNACAHELRNVVPTLNIPSGAIAGTNQGTIVYTISGMPA